MPVSVGEQALVSMISTGRLDPGQYVTHTLPLRDGREAYEHLTSGRENRGDALKSVLSA